MDPETLFNKLMLGLVIFVPVGGLMGGGMGALIALVFFLLPAGILFFANNGFGVGYDIKWSAEFPKEGQVPYDYFGFDELPLTPSEVARQNDLEWKIRYEIRHWPSTDNINIYKKYCRAVYSTDPEHCISLNNKDEKCYREIVHYDPNLKQEVVVKRQYFGSWSLYNKWGGDRKIIKDFDSKKCPMCNTPFEPVQGFCQSCGVNIEYIRRYLAKENLVEKLDSEHNINIQNMNAAENRMPATQETVFVTTDTIESLENERRISVKNIKAMESRIPTPKAVFKEAFQETVGELLWPLVFFILGNLAAVITTLCIISGVEESISGACLIVVFCLVFAWFFPMIEFRKRMLQRDTQIESLNKERDNLCEIENRIKILSKKQG